MKQHCETTLDIFVGYFILPPLLSVLHTVSGLPGWGGHHDLLTFNPNPEKPSCAPRPHPPRGKAALTM